MIPSGSCEAMSSIASSGGLVSSGGPYYMISRALGRPKVLYSGLGFPNNNIGIMEKHREYANDSNNIGYIKVELW